MVWVVSLSTVQLIPHGLTARVVNMVFGVWFSEVPREGPPSNSVSLPPTHSGTRLSQKIFRRERAISQFD